MGTAATALFLTGPPGSGKTTLLKEALASSHLRAGGFYTEEVREGPRRVGFDLVTLDGDRAPLARADFPSQYRVGKYGVDPDTVERVGLPALREALEAMDLVVIDEVGKMELFSQPFRTFLLEALERGKPLLGVIMASPHPFADRVKAHPRVRLVWLTPLVREKARGEVLRWLSTQVPSPQGHPIFSER